MTRANSHWVTNSLMLFWVLSKLILRLEMGKKVVYLEIVMAFLVCQLGKVQSPLVQSKTNLGDCEVILQIYLKLLMS